MKIAMKKELDVRKLLTQLELSYDKFARWQVAQETDESRTTTAPHKEWSGTDVQQEASFSEQEQEAVAFLQTTR